MAEPTTEVRFAKATVTTPIAGEEVVSSMYMTISLDTPPTVEFVTHPKKDAKQQAIAMSNAEVAKTVGQGQSIIFKSRSSPDTTLTVKDGKGGNLVFKGFYSNPSYTYGQGFAGMKQTAIHESAALDAMTPEIYTHADGDGWHVTDERVKADNLAQRIHKLHEKIIKHWEKNKGQDDSPPKEKMIREKVHAINAKLVDKWYKILDNSTDTMDWPEISNLGDNQKDELDRLIVATLTQQTDSFFGVLTRFNSMFQTVWIPDMGGTGKMGKYVRRSKLFSEVSDLKAAPISLSYSGGNSRLLPVTHCIVMMDGLMKYKQTDKGMAAVPAGIVSAWPEAPYTGGRAIRDPGPPWLGTVDVPAETLTVESDRLDLGKYISARSAAIGDVGSKMLDTCLKIAEAWARDIYNWSALSGAAADLTIPMDVSIMPGKYMTVSTASGELFKGLVHTVVHTMVAGDSGSGGTATTALSFTNVEAGSFKLPNR